MNIKANLIRVPIIAAIILAFGTDGICGNDNINLKVYHSMRIPHHLIEVTLKLDGIYCKIETHTKTHRRYSHENKWQEFDYQNTISSKFCEDIFSMIENLETKKVSEEFRAIADGTSWILSGNHKKVYFEHRADTPESYAFDEYTEYFYEIGSKILEAGKVDSYKLLPK